MKDGENLPAESKISLIKCQAHGGAFITEGNIKMNTFTGKGNYNAAITNNKWTQGKVQSGIESTKTPCWEKNTLLQRCLVGVFIGGEEAPTRNDVRRWASQTWKGVPNLQVFDMNGFQFLFEFPSRRAAEHILMGEWERKGQALNLEWWSPTSSAIPKSTKYDWLWIRVLGLPLRLWDEKTMRKLEKSVAVGWKMRRRQNSKIT